ncbi:Uncaracterized surface protein containing fasciclin (FAS1) repeats [Sphingopyxis sp. YR583]|uniref:fasciclin domain-containing protein n=1 Tax=Sphingopyxis sp. YR583 TaxID=1881047 RepID=UPI0008A798FE|nr:fasciclin domain-containing protein [Sphingopyxis sp. YR583]SEH18653.1 Uncaracterized surface protein containing fasciclin (FAS1) repeats [Sphingopyxis sp. YR583]
MKTPLILTIAAAALALSGCGGKTDAPDEPTTVASSETVAPAAAAAPSAMLGSNTIAANIAASPDYKSLAAAVTQAGLTQTLSGAGPFTLFAPNDAGFAQVPPVTRDGWMRPAQKDVLAGVLKYHVVPGKLTAADLAAKITEGGGKAVLKTVDGQDLTATKSGDAILLTSASGNKAAVTQADVGQSNGVIHVIDAVLLPKM